VENGIKTIAFPAISCGVYGYPIPEAARIAMDTVAAFLKSHDAVALVRFVLFGPTTYAAFLDAFTEL
jgi:O-acetyl-ADP-ribose deacetylase (regulator of RNase III)